jgi:hypothetical protein
VKVHCQGYRNEGFPAGCVYQSSICGSATFYGSPLRYFKLDAVIVSIGDWETVPLVAQCKRCRSGLRRYGSRLGMCASDAQITAVEAALHGIASAFTEQSYTSQTIAPSSSVTPDTRATSPCTRTSR